MNKLAQPKRQASHEDVAGPAYVSMAEAITKFQRGTPQRFHTKPRMTQFLQPPHGPSSKVRSSTVPHSPALSTKLRTRPVTALTHEQQELKEFEEAKK